MVSGEVARPGAVAIHKDGKLDLENALINAGNPTAQADRSRIEVVRTEEGRSYFYDFEDIEAGKHSNVFLKGGDRIVVRKSPFAGEKITVSGEVGKKGFLSFPLDGKLTIRDAITMAGDFTQLANRKGILERPGFEPQTYDLDDLAEKGLVIWLRPNDVIIAKRRFF
jgi:protein involved in polysaccharide export with SLBB domain